MKHTVRRSLLAIAAALSVLIVAGAAYGAALTQTLAGGDSLAVKCAGSQLNWSRQNSTSMTLKCRPSATPTPSVTPSTTPSSSPSPTPSTSPTPSPTPSPSNSGGYSCNVGYGQNCGAYAWNGWPGSNGYNTYVVDQLVNPHGSESLHANSPSDWQIIANDASCGGCVQTFPDAQQLTNNWNGHGWGGQVGDVDTPLAALSTLSISYSETSPTSAFSQYEFAPDIWQDNYGSDVMFWADTKGRCNEGAFGGTILGHALIDGQSWTVHRYGGPGAEVIFVLDAPGGSGTCAQQHSGTINIKAGLEWLVANGFESGPIVLSQINTGWEITQADNQAFTLTALKYNVALA